MKSRKTLAIVIGICAFFISLAAAFIAYTIYLRRTLSEIFAGFSFDDFLEEDYTPTINDSSNDCYEE